MGIIDYIKGLLNPEIISTYNEIISSHVHAYYRWRRKHDFMLSQYVDSSPTYADQYYIATHRDEIIKVEKEIEEERAYLKRREEVISAASIYPHAFHAMILKLSMPSIYDVNAILPGVRKSKRNQRAANRVSSVLPCPIMAKIDGKKYEIRAASKERTLDRLRKDEYERIFYSLPFLKQEEQRIKKELAYEDLIFKFEDEILDNSRRLKYYKKFLNINHINTEQEIYCAEHLKELDAFIDSQIEEEFNAIAEDYPLGVQYYKEHYSNISSFKEYVIEKIDYVVKYNDAIPKYESLKKKYPLGLPAFEHANSYDDGKNSASLYMWEVVEHEDEIKVFENNAQSVQFFKNWETTQKEFCSICRELKNTEFPEWGCYNYSIPFEKIGYNGGKTDGSYIVWQLFARSFCVSDEVDMSYYPSYKKNKDLIPLFLNNSNYFVDKLYDKIISFIDKIVCKYIEGDGVVVLFADSGVNDAKELNDFQFRYLRKRLDERHVKYKALSNNPLVVEDTVHYVVIELISTNERLITNCSALLNTKISCHNSCLKSERNKCYTDIVYISLFKGYDKEEMEKINQKRIEEIEKERIEEEKRKKEEQERIVAIQLAKQIAKSYNLAFRRLFPDISLGSLEYEQAQKIINLNKVIEEKNSFINRIKEAVSDWEQLRGIPYYFFYYYYPTRFTEITPLSQEVRTLIYNFKDGISNTKLATMIISKLSCTFNEEDLKEMTLVCIPASTISENEKRYSLFSKKVCSGTGMRNAFEHITITKEKEKSHLGGTDAAEYSFDEAFFKDADVVLFDDVVTRGRSMQEFYSYMKELGANVVCSISIGRTYSDYHGDDRKPHPWTGTM